MTRRPMVDPSMARLMEKYAPAAQARSIKPVTAAAIGTGLAVVILASGALGGPKSKVGNLLVPLRPVSSALIDPANPRALGSPTAPVTIEVCSDFRCPACYTFSKTVEPGLIDAYVATGKAGLV
jgi:protein-disulfide isomerase